VSGRPALNSHASPRVLVMDDGKAEGADVFDVIGEDGNVIRARSAFLFEVGEELSVRIEHAGSVSEATARVRGHVGPADAQVTELEISDRSAPRPAPRPAGAGE
jgi:hypothetical protein